jgi:PAS domain-containing protein
MEQRLSLSDEAFKSMREAITITDMDANVVFWNKANEDLFNIKEEDAWANLFSMLLTWWNRPENK